MNYTDQIGNQIYLSETPKRIVSLVPSQTEYLAALNLKNEVIGITKFCIYPSKWFKSKTKVGGTKNIDIQKIIDLRPDLIIANKEENDKEKIETLQKHFPVWTSDIKNLEDALSMIKDLGIILNKVPESTKIKNIITVAFNELNRNQPCKLKAAYMIWDKPMMAAGGKTFIHEMMQLAGFENVFAHQNRYPQIEEVDLFNHQPDILLLSSEPFPFKEKHVEKYKKLLPNCQIVLVDGTMFSWYGSRLSQSPAYFKNLWATL